MSDTERWDGRGSGVPPEGYVLYNEEERKYICPHCDSRLLRIGGYAECSNCGSKFRRRGGDA